MTDSSCSGCGGSWKDEYVIDSRTTGWIMCLCEECFEKHRRGKLLPNGPIDKRDRDSKEEVECDG